MANAYYRKSQKSDHKKDISFEKLKICEVLDVFDLDFFYYGMDFLRNR